MASYFVGMIYPGRQALFSGFHFEFDAPHASPTFLPQNIAATTDPRFNEVRVEGTSRAGAFRLKAFVRPLPVMHTVETIQAAVGRSERLQGRTAFISGASRGFGAVLARSFACQGADVIVNFKASKREAEAIREEIVGLGRRAWALGADVARGDQTKHLQEHVERAAGAIDFLVLNASPAIYAENFLQQDTEKFCRFVDETLRATCALVQGLFPLLTEEANVIFISSSYALKGEPLFSHYVAAKRAVEGLIRTLAMECPKLRFMIARPPKMLTDQTNLPFHLEQPASAVDVAAQLMRHLPVAREESLVEINLS